MLRQLQRRSELPLAVIAKTDQRHAELSRLRPGLIRAAEPRGKRKSGRAERKPPEKFTAGNRTETRAGRSTHGDATVRASISWANRRGVPSLNSVKGSVCTGVRLP